MTPTPGLRCVNCSSSPARTSLLGPSPICEPCREALVAAPHPRSFCAAYWRLLDRRRITGTCKALILSETDEAHEDRWQRELAGERTEIAPTRERERELTRMVADYDNGAYIGFMRLLEYISKQDDLGILLPDPRKAHYAILKRAWDPYIETRNYLRGEHELPYVYACRIALAVTRHRMRPYHI